MVKSITPIKPIHRKDLKLPFNKIGKTFKLLINIIDHIKNIKNRKEDKMLM